MAYIDSFNINKTDYDARYLRNVGINEVTSLSNLPINKRMIHATLSESSVLSIQDGMEVGEGLIVICECAAEFELQFNSDSKYKFIGETGISKPILCQNETMFKIYITKSSDSSYVINLSRIFKEMPRDFILVSTNSGGSANLIKYTDPNGSSTEKIIIPAGSTNYKVDGLIYGFELDADYGSDYEPYITITSFDLSNFDTSNVTNMRNMFSDCSGLTSLDVSNFDTSNVTNMRNMFRGCSGLTSLDVSNFDTSKVTDMVSMFYYCSGLTSLDLSNFDTSKVTDMASMFYYCSGLTSLDLSNFDTSNVASNVARVRYMFRGCNKLSKIKCKQAFKDWCWANQDYIGLPAAMRNGGGGNWEIVS